MGGYIASVYENVTVRNFAWVERVSVRDTDDTDRFVVSRLPVRTQMGEEMVAQASNEVQGLGEESIEEVRAVEWRGRCEQVEYG
jgi:hypothetical protein